MANDSILPCNELIRDSIHVHLICMFQEDAEDKVTEAFQQSRGCNSKINESIWPVSKLIQDCVHVPLICKFQELNELC